jgi:hypothetical protein
MKFSSVFAVALALSTTTACLDDVDPDDEAALEDLDSAEAEAAVSRTHTFTVESKSYIAPISNAMVGSLGPLIDPQLHLFAAATNFGFSENPTTGAKALEQYRIWGHVELKVTCVGTSATMSLRNPATDAGFEGPLKGEIDPIQTSASGTAFSYQVGGRPHILTEPGFLAVFPRFNRTIWYRVNGHVACDAASQATLTIDSVVNTKFPSVRIWAKRTTVGGASVPEAQIFQRVQGKFTELWFLANKPAF